MKQIETNLVPKSSEKYRCENCDYNTSRKSQYDRHLLTDKHIFSADETILKQNSSKKFECLCGFTFNSRTTLWRHKKICSGENVIVNDNVIVSKNTNDIAPELIKLITELVKGQTGLQESILELCKNGTHNNTTTNSHNKAFNLNFFLNETCKDAMNIMDFVESIQLQLSDLEKMGEIGYVEGISNIIVKNLNALDVSQRPLHCTDKKRETIYIKDEDKWEKDEEQKKIRKVIKKVANKNAMLIQQFKEKHPDYNKYHSKYSTQYHKLIIESFGGSGDNDLEKEDKIIRNISKNVVVDK
jgi:hypothetical protein